MAFVQLSTKLSISVEDFLKLSAILGNYRQNYRYRKFTENYRKIIVIEKFDLSPTPKWDTKDRGVRGVWALGRQETQERQETQGGDRRHGEDKRHRRHRADQADWVKMGKIVTPKNIHPRKYLPMKNIPP